MKRWEVENAVKHAPISNSAKVVGLAIASHWSADKDQARLKLETIGREIGGKSNRTVIRAINELVQFGVFKRIKTGRSSILRPGFEKRNEGFATYSRGDKIDVYLNPDWRKIFPLAASLTDEECLAELKAWADELAAQDQAKAPHNGPEIKDRTDGLFGSHFQSICPYDERLETRAERYVKDCMLYVPVKNVTSTIGTETTFGERQ